ncbi:ubiquinone anaerobic biosynthesis accessory factor UbiT [Diaphorobacter caeni]|uniref:ubiquinone anaerobic biosynthesis accessory factor UbiT n=1 Tax=Diaphorobacter caeni TaxID=2784387 RepID=UPI00188EE622|nr:SCP2 sterol-binding domain-containing protein [Diaphorobacter caeni]MBF5003303.1 SCP2 sterol-binding domain-containing protein [Diaphorobacter caeni]
MNITASSSPLAVPAPLGSLLSRLPAYPGSLLLVTAINFMLARQLPDDVKALLKGRQLSIRVTDARVAFDFVCDGERFTASAPKPDPDLVVSASAWDFVQLAQRKQDPDTLFFSRRLVMQGDTELGLVVKNALDALELPVLDPMHWTPRAVLARWSAGKRQHGE